jgi:hypothetical protein
MIIMRLLKTMPPSLETLPPLEEKGVRSPRKGSVLVSLEKITMFLRAVIRIGTTRSLMTRHSSMLRRGRRGVRWPRSATRGGSVTHAGRANDLNQSCLMVVDSEI